MNIKGHLRSIFFKIFKLLYDKSFLPRDLVYSYSQDKLEIEEDIFYTYHKRPKNSTGCGLSYQFKPCVEKNAIVVQGPLMHSDDFTYESLKLYRKHFPDTLIILSTWKDEDAVKLSAIEQLGVIVLQNDKPDFPGLSHINYQIKSTASGILRAKENGATYVLKTRTDQRFYNPGTIPFLYNMIKTFPLNKVKERQKERLIIPSINTFLYRLNGITDMLMFGNIDDMLLYWNIDWDTRIIEAQNKHFTVEEFSALEACELYLSNKFYQQVNFNTEKNLLNSWKFLAESFCVIDDSSIDLFWPKYFKNKEFRYRYYNSNNTHQIVSFSDWLAIYHHQFDKFPNLKGLMEGQDFLSDN